MVAGAVIPGSGGGTFQVLRFGRESVSAPGDGDDQGRGLRIVTERRPDFADRNREIGFLHHPAVPHLVEQNLPLVRRIADTVVVLDAGQVMHRGGAAELVADPELTRELLGVSMRR